MLISFVTFLRMLGRGRGRGGGRCDRPRRHEVCLLDKILAREEGVG